MKRWLVILFLILILFCGTAQAVSEEGYNWIPKQDSYVLAKRMGNQAAIIIITFHDPISWFLFTKKEYNLPPDKLRGSAIRTEYPNGKVNYQIDIPYEPDGSINLDSLGHELAHILDHEWHK